VCEAVGEEDGDEHEGRHGVEALDLGGVSKLHNNGDGVDVLLLFWPAFHRRL
jgi:hypothetical protein